MTIPYLTVTMLMRDVEAADVERLFRVLHEWGGVFQSVEYTETVAVPMPPDIPDPAPLPPHVPPPVVKTLPLRADAGRTGQDAINVFKRAFGDGLSGDGKTPWYIVKLAQSGLQTAGIFTPMGRALQYTVPPYFYIEDMAGLDGGAMDRQKLLDALK